ncbi:hypothetical protein Bca4012_025484 [Brassica carinata]
MSIVARNVQSYVTVNLSEPSSETQKIRVKIINRWTLYNSKSDNSIELVLVDSSDTRLHASIENDLVHKHRHLLNEGQALSINAFSLKEYGEDFKTSSFPFKLAILRTTRTKELTDCPDDVPEKYFIDFGDILDGKYEKNLLIVPPPSSKAGSYWTELADLANFTPQNSTTYHLFTVVETDENCLINVLTATVSTTTTTEGRRKHQKSKKSLRKRVSGIVLTDPRPHKGHSCWEIPSQNMHTGKKKVYH